MFFVQDPNNKITDTNRTPPAPQPILEPDYINAKVMVESFGNYNQNPLALFLAKLVGVEKAKQVIKTYNIGTDKNGEVIFWQMDMEGKIRTGKMMKYNLTDSVDTFLKKDCKRVHEGNEADWKHPTTNGFNLVQCYFGVHQLNANPDKKVMIVEGEKTAVFGSIYLPQYVWLSCGGSGNLLGKDCTKLPALQGRDVILFPDLSKPKLNMIRRLTKFGKEKWI